MIETRKLDIVVVDKKSGETMIIGITIPGDYRSREQEAEKIHKYQDLVVEVNWTWKSKAKVILIIVGMFGPVNHLKRLTGITTYQRSLYVITFSKQCSWNLVTY